MLGFLIANSPVLAGERIVFDNIDQVFTAIVQFEACKEERTLLEEQSLQLKSHIKLLKEENELQALQLKLLHEKADALAALIETYKGTNESLVKIIQYQQEIANEIVKASKPSFFEKAQEDVTLMISGGVITALLLLIL
jgi:hypothetical protein